MTLNELPAHSRLWIYQSDREISDGESTEMLEQLNNFISNWAAHGAQLAASCELRYGYFLILAVDELQAKATGCSIDSSVHFIQQLGNQFGIDFFNRLNVAFKSGDGIQLMKMFDFEEGLQNGSIPEDTIVFNNLIQTMGEFQNQWEVAIENSWHAQLLPS